MIAPSPPIYEFGEFRLDVAERQLMRRDGTAVLLAPRVFATLRYLLEHSGRVLDKEVIMEAVWPDCIVEENNLTQNISALRRLLGDSPGAHRYIATVAGRGYRFVAPVTTREHDNSSRPNSALEVQFGGPDEIVRSEEKMYPSEAASVFPTLRAHPLRLGITRVALLTFFLLGMVVFFFLRNRAHHEVKTPARLESQTVIPDRSIAVLPFANLSANQESAFFAEGVQDDILTAISRIAELKVISRASVASYIAGRPRDPRQIGQELGVSQIVEGSVRRAGDRVRVAVQLIDTRTNVQVWAETYDRTLADVFAIQMEIAQQIATQLQAKLSPTEQSALGERPTDDLVAYDLYLRARAIWGGWTSAIPAAETLLEAVGFLDQAVARDPQFFQAYCHLARVHDLVYFDGIDHLPARLSLAEAAIAAAERLRPNSGEIHLLRAEHLYRGYLKYDEARSELAIAQRLLSNDSQIFGLMAAIDRRQGRWSESTRNYEKALELSPRDPSLLGNAAVNYEYQRRFAEAALLRDRLVILFPRGLEARRERAAIELSWRADPRPLHEAINRIVAEKPLSAWENADLWLNFALCEHDPVMAERALAAMKMKILDSVFGFPHAWYEGLIAWARNDEESARSAFASARLEAETMVRERPGDGPSLCVLGMVDAALGRKEEAIREGRRAVELLPVTKNAMEGAILMEYLGIIYAWSGDKDAAIEQVAATLQIPSQLNYGYLRLHPVWDPLRGDPRFEKIVADLAPAANSGR